jgi:hypothetical protein
MAGGPTLDRHCFSCIVLFHRSPGGKEPLKEAFSKAPLPPWRAPDNRSSYNCSVRIETKCSTLFAFPRSSRSPVVDGGRPTGPSLLRRTGTPGKASEVFECDGRQRKGLPRYAKGRWVSTGIEMVFRTVLIACGIVAVVLSVVAVIKYSVSGEPEDMETRHYDDPATPDSHESSLRGQPASVEITDCSRLTSLDASVCPTSALNKTA